VSGAVQTRYVRTRDGVYVAYQTWGEGPDLLLVPGFISHLEVAWESPLFSRLYERLGSFARVTTFDKRGTGMSDRPPELPDADQRMLDMLAVLDAVEAGPVSLFSISEGAALSVLLAATHPHRVASLAVFGGYARPTTGPDHPIGTTPGQLEAMATYLQEHWGTGVALRAFAPSLAGDANAREWWARLQRMAASPTAARALTHGYNVIDVRPALGLVHAPTLILHRSDDRMVSVALARELHDGIPGSRLVEFPGSDHLLPTTNWSLIVDALEEFVTGRPAVAEADRFLATVLFTDIVDSTRHLAALGDDEWQHVLASHDALARREVERYGGRVVHGTGDGLLAVFDGPSRAIRAALAITAQVEALGIRVRAGLHTGEIVERPDGDLAGLAVHLAARVAGRAGADEVLVSSTTAALVVGSSLAFDEAGLHDLKGIDGATQLFRARSGP
jgi:class 3 adenylate cyclase/alpha-beta hydrolase superfamily lysophospholipase